MAAMTYRGRLAPSPTGETHLGHARTYLVAWLRARESGGTLVMRIEDLDGPRVVEGATEQICADLRWLGLDWDEGPDLGGSYGPYSQSERDGFYDEALQRLEAAGDVYLCTCSRKEIERTASAPHGADGLGLRYPGTCRLGPSHPDRSGATRFRMPEPPPDVHDELHGPCTADAWGGDFVVRRADGVWAYQLAVVVDDAAMGITEVVRGDDLLPSTPRQLALFDALGRTAPHYLHVPLVMGADGRRLAKRHASAGLRSLREAGWSAGRLRGWLGRSLGLEVSAEPSLEALLEAFSVDALPRAPVLGLSWNAPGGGGVDIER